MTEISSTAIEAAAVRLAADVGVPWSILVDQGREAWIIRAEAALEASGLPADLQAAQERATEAEEKLVRVSARSPSLTLWAETEERLTAERDAAQKRAEQAEVDRDGLWRSLTEGDDHDPRCEGQCGPCGGCGGVEMMRCLTCGGSGECGGCSQAYLLGRERTRRRVLEEIELPRLTAERDQLASQLQGAREIVGNLRTAAREVGEFFDFAAPGLSEFAGHDLEGCEGDPTTALLSLHDFANDAERFLSETETKP